MKIPETPDWMYHSVIARQPPTDNSIIIIVAISSIIIIITLLANLATKSRYGKEQRRQIMGWLKDLQLN